MDTSLLALLVSSFVVVIVCSIVVIIRQVLNDKETKNRTVSGSDNHIMKTEQYSGKYSRCVKIGEANAEF